MTTAPLRILQIVPSISLVYGGPSQMVLGLSQALAAAGVQVTILTTNSNGDTGQAPLDVPLDRPVPQDGYQIRYFPCSPFRRYKFSIPLLRWLSQHAHEFDLAHIHALFSPVSTAAATVARRAQLPYIMRPLGTLDPADLRKKRWAKQIYAALWERPNLAGAAAVHFTTAEEARISERFGVTTRDVVIPLGVTPPTPTPDQRTHIRQQLGIAEDVPIVLFMSRIDPKKGLDLLIPALLERLAAGDRFHFILAGSNPQDPAYEASIRQQIANSPLNACTSITGFVTGERKAHLLDLADLFVLPSYYENFGIAVAEAMAAGKPVIISQGVYIWNEVEQAAAGWICRDRASLSQHLHTALQNPSDRQQRGHNAQTYALKHYSWEAIARQTMEVYAELVMGNR